MKDRVKGPAKEKPIPVQVPQGAQEYLEAIYEMEEEGGRIAQSRIAKRLGVSAPAADFKGAAEVIRQAAQASPKPKEKPKDPNAPFREKLKAFAAASTNLPPAAAATRWLDLVEEFEQRAKNFQ